VRSTTQIIIRRVVVAAILIATLDAPTLATPATDFDQVMAAGLAKYRNGDLAGAKPELDRAVSIAAAFGPSDPRIAEAYNLLGVVYYVQRDFVPAENNLLLAKQRLEVSGPISDGFGAAVLHNLGSLYAMTRQYDKAEPLLLAGLDVRTRLFGARHSDVALSLHELAALYAKKHDNERALDYARRGMALTRDLYGKDHPETAYALNMLGLSILEELKAPAEALPMFEDAARISELKRVDPVESLDAGLKATAQMNLGLCLERLGRNQEALTRFQNALSLATPKTDQVHFIVPFCRLHVGTIQLAQGDLRAAEVTLRSVFEYQEKNRLPDTAEVAITCDVLASLIESEGKADEAAKLRAHAQEIRRLLAAR
jgi:tetratricopeptide (TPR) repeat protein